jgi:hypothetical protein
MRSNVEPDKTGKRKQASIPFRTADGLVCVCRLAVFKFVMDGSIDTVLQSTKGLAVNRQPEVQTSIT